VPKTHLGRFGFVLGVMALTVACVTVNIYFPAAKVEKAAEKIVDEVYQDKGAQEKKPGDSSSLEMFLAWLGPREAWAGANAATVSNAAIRALKNQIAQRHGQLAPYYQEGAIGIMKNGLLAVRNVKGLPMAQVANLRRLVSADNAARGRPYQEIARAMNLKGGQVGEIQKIFAKVWRDKAAPGWFIQEDNGAWRRK